jgi:hypothetical protein
MAEQNQNSKIPAYVYGDGQGGEFVVAISVVVD